MRPRDCNRRSFLWQPGRGTSENQSHGHIFQEILLAVASLLLECGAHLYAIVRAFGEHFGIPTTNIRRDLAVRQHSEDGGLASGRGLIMAVR
jgi:hypothetical protein